MTYSCVFVYGLLDSHLGAVVDVVIAMSAMMTAMMICVVVVVSSSNGVFAVSLELLSPSSSSSVSTWTSTLPMVVASRW